MPVNLVNKSGRVVTVRSEEDAAALERAFGYTRETAEGAAQAGIETGTRRYYEDQKVATFVEGAASGATFGVSDVILDATGADTAERARYNPKTRLAGEITGMVGSSIIGVGPTGMVSKGAAKILAKPGVGLGTKLAVAGLEGAAYGGGSAISQAALSDEPMTVQSALAHMGVGAAFGVGTQILGHTLQSAGTRLTQGAAKAEKAAAVVAEDWSAAHRVVSNAAKQLKDDAAKLSDEVAGWVKEMPKEYASSLRKIASATDEKQLAKAVASLKTVKPTSGEMVKPEVFDGLITNAQAAMEKRASASALSKFPSSAEGLKRMSSGQMELFSAALAKQDASVVDPVLSMFSRSGANVNKVDDIATALGGMKSAGVKSSPGVATGAEKVVEKTGEKAKGVPWSFAGLLRQKAINDPKVAAGALGVGMLSDNSTLKNVGLFGLVMAARGNLRQTIAESAGMLGKRLQGAGRAVERLKKPIVSLGTPLAFPEYREKPRSPTHAARLAVDEVNYLAQGAAETAYYATQDIRASDPIFAAAVQKQMVNQVNWLNSQAPKNPGNVVVGGKDVWEPTPLAAAKFAEERFVFNDLKGAMEQFMSGDMGWYGLAAFKALWPDVHQELSQQLLAQHNPENMSFKDRAILSDITGVTLDASRKPENVAFWQAMHMPKGPQAAPAQPQQSRQSGVTISKETPGLTQSQKLEA